MVTKRATGIRVLLATTSFGVLATMAAAQSDRTVILQASDGGMAISGELLGIDNNSYHLSTAAGEMTISPDGVTCFGNACPTVEPVFQRGGAVMLTAPDSSMNIAGKIDAVEGDHYIIQTEGLGMMQIRTEGVTCSGPGCPSGLILKASATAPSPAAPRVNPASARVRFAGSDTVGLGLLPYLMEDYADFLGATAQKTDLSETETYMRYVNASGVEVTSLFANSTGSGDAFDALEVRGAEFGMASRPAKDSEAARLIAAGAGEVRNTENETVIAVDSLAVITHPSNPVRDLSMGEIGAIYLGQITNWSQVGGPNAPITVLSREDGSSTRGVFEKAVFSGEEPPLAARVTYPGGDNPEMAAAVRNDPYAIGYVGFAYSEGLNRLDLTSECGITSTATSFAVKTEEYPLGRRLYLYNRPDNLPSDARRFLQYALSPEADDAIAQSSFVNFAVERTVQPRSRIDNLFRDLVDQSEFRLASQLRDDLRDWDRLSTTIRFPTGSSALGKKELNDIDRLIAYLEDLPNGTRVAIVGFADSVGGFENNVRLSGRRALSVAQTISSIGGDRLSGISFERRAYGELAPSVCNTEANGRTINRRVELWVRK
ncbi:substrate-binding domain-containing protein [Yoonia sp. SDW83-1]|uniref:substrate-binding domain-containing protein n=1 Tax=Yoonia sp. SDW83-1 TaxID=3366945 RepID=UPI00398C7D07